MLDIRRTSRSSRHHRKEGDLLALLIALLSGDFPLAADADALEGVEVADMV
jgi:hypothetical protein